MVHITDCEKKKKVSMFHQKSVVVLTTRFLLNRICHREGKIRTALGTEQDKEMPGREIQNISIKFRTGSHQHCIGQKSKNI